MSSVIVMEGKIIINHAFTLTAEATSGLVDILYIVLAIFVFGILIFVHELGHYLSARIFKVKINEFAIGMGPKLFSKTSKKTDIAYSLRLFPIGGFVSMAGEDEQSDDENALSKKPAWQKFIITIAGAAMNIIVGIVAMTLLVALSSSMKIGGTQVAQFIEGYETYAEESGIMVGDTIVKIGDEKVKYSSDLVYAILDECVEPVDVVVEREGQSVTVENVVFPTFEEQGIVYGERFFLVNAMEKNFSNVISYSLSTSFSTIEMIWDSLMGLISGKYGLSSVSGPVGTTTTVAESAKGGISNLVYISVFITMNLGIFNLLPLPALDGGRLVFILIEMIRRKPIDPKYEGYVHFAGIVLLMLLMVLITFKDVISLFG